MKDEELRTRERMEAARREALARDITADFLRRQEERKLLERGWQIDMNFVRGEQYCDISPLGEIEDEGAAYFWQSRGCYNHIAPTVDARLARLSKVRPALTVRAFSDSPEDLKTARLCSNILKAVKGRVDLDRVIARATLWSEVCGTAFYKIVWNFDEGRLIGAAGDRPLREGDVNIAALSPFEVYPDSLTAESLEEVRSLIHAKAMPVSEIRERYGVELAGRRVDGFAAAPCAAGMGPTVLEDAEIVIERYTRPDRAHPEGRLEIAAGGVLLYEGPLPYENGERGERTFPFVRQTCTELPGSFYGVSIVDRMVPLQRAYNAVRNRKHEFLNRLSMGVLAVEDGSLDAEELAEEGLAPGRVLVYRQGANEPHFLDFGSLPSDFREEEERLANEFILVSGVSELSRSSSSSYRVTSASGLQLLLEQDTNRMQTSAESVERAVRAAGKQILHLYKQFATSRRLLRMTGEGGETELYYFDRSDISADDVEFLTEYDRTPAEVKEEILSLFRAGLLQDGAGNLSDETRNKILDAFGYGSFENARDITHLHLRKAERENIVLREQTVLPEAYDDHALHIREHTRALLSGGENDGAVKERIAAHIAAHRELQGK